LVTTLAWGIIPHFICNPCYFDDLLSIVKWKKIGFQLFHSKAQKYWLFWTTFGGIFFSFFVSLKIAIFEDMKKYENANKGKNIQPKRQKWFQITNIFALLNEKAEIKNFVILLLKVVHYFNIDCNWNEGLSLERGVVPNLFSSWPCNDNVHQHLNIDFRSIIISCCIKSFIYKYNSQRTLFSGNQCRSRQQILWQEKEAYEVNEIFWWLGKKSINMSTSYPKFNMLRLTTKTSLTSFLIIAHNCVNICEIFVWKHVYSSLFP